MLAGMPRRYQLALTASWLVSATRRANSLAGVRAIRRGGSRFVVDCQPDRRLPRHGPFNPMAPPWRDVEVIAGLEVLRQRLVLEVQQGLPLKQQDPLAARLFVPETRWARLAGRHDALDAEPGPGKQCEKLLVGR